MAVKKSDDTTTIQWTGSAGIESAKALQKELLKALKSPAKTVLLDISEIDDIDLSGIQLILASKKEADTLGKAFFITNKIPQAISEFVSGCSISFEPLLAPADSKEAE